VPNVTVPNCEGGLEDSGSPHNGTLGPRLPFVEGRLSSLRRAGGETGIPGICFHKEYPMGNRLIGAALAAMGLVASFGCDRKDDHRMSQRSDQDNTNTSRSKTGTPYSEPQESQKSEYPQNQVNQYWDNADKSFMTTAAQANLAEVEPGRMAAEKSTNSDVKKFGQMMVDDHSQANTQLMDLAQKKNLTLPNQPDDAHKKDAARLADLNGAEFDRAYMTGMVQEHVKAVALFEANSKSAKDTDVRTFAEKTLPVLKHHLQMARDLNSKVSGPTGAD